MSFLNSDEKSALRKQIQQVESGTQAEIVTVIARQSDGYRYIPVLWAALIALSIPGLYYLWSIMTQSGWITLDERVQMQSWLYAVQVLVFLGLGMLFQVPAARMFVIPSTVKRQRAARHAREQFFLQNLHQTRNRTGVLIFVSVAEHYVEIIVDSAIAETVDNTRWAQAVDEFVTKVKSGHIASAFSCASG